MYQLSDIESACVFAGRGRIFGRLFYGYPQRIKEIRGDDTLNHVSIIVLSEDADDQRQP